MKKRSPRSSETTSPAASLAKAVQSELRRQGCYGGGAREALPVPSPLPSASAHPSAATGDTNASGIITRTLVPPSLMEARIRPWTASELQMDQVKAKKSWWPEMGEPLSAGLSALLKFAALAFAAHLVFSGFTAVLDWLFG